MQGTNNINNPWRVGFYDVYRAVTGGTYNYHAGFIYAPVSGEPQQFERDTITHIHGRWWLGEWWSQL